MALVTISAEQMPFEVGAQLLGILAFPENPVRARAAADAWCAQMIQADLVVFPDSAEIVRVDYPQYARMRNWEIRRGLRSATTRLRYRAIAARMSRGFFFENLYSQPAELPEGMTRLSLNQLSVLVKPESRQNDPENIEKRIWRSSRKIIHLASAFDRLVDRAAANDNGYHIADYRLTARILELAEARERIVLEDRRFGVAHDDLIRVRVA